MKRLLHIQFLLVLLLALGYSSLQAKRITQWQAQQQAYSFWGKQMPQKARAKSRKATTASPSDAYYVFNNDAGGFVIIAGDDAVTPVLGYTSTGSFDAENLPDGLKDLLKSYERQIAALGDNYVANQTATRAAFTGENLLNTAKWNQGNPFNKYTPNNYVTGCVATAGAIVMKPTAILPRAPEAILIPGTARPSQPISSIPTTGQACLPNMTAPTMLPSTAWQY